MRMFASSPEDGIGQPSPEGVLVVTFRELGVRNAAVSILMSRILFGDTMVPNIE